MYSWWPVCWHVWWFSVMSFYSNICLNLICGDPNDLNSGGFLEERICFSNFCWEPENHFNPFGGATVTVELPKSIFLSLRPPLQWSLCACPRARGSICSKKTLVFLVVCCSISEYWFFFIFLFFWICRVCVKFFWYMCAVWVSNIPLILVNPAMTLKYVAVLYSGSFVWYLEECFPSVFSATWLKVEACGLLFSSGSSFLWLVLDRSAALAPALRLYLQPPLPLIPPASLQVWQSISVLKEILGRTSSS